MIRLHRLNGFEVVINAELIETIEGGPDTVIVLATNNRFIVKESIDEVIQRVVEYQRSVRPDEVRFPKVLRREVHPKVSGGSAQT